MPIARPAPASRTTLVLFGPPRLERDGLALHVGMRKAMAVLALLALDGALTRERLAALLWRDVDASTAWTALPAPRSTPSSPAHAAACCSNATLRFIGMP